MVVPSRRKSTDVDFHGATVDVRRKSQQALTSGPDLCAPWRHDDRGRRPSTPRPSRSAPRPRILGAAREQFAQQGYDRASIRSIAAQASIDPALVMRYFTSKEALFAAAVDVDLMLPDLSGVAVEDLGARLTRHFLERWEGALSDDVLLILLRSAVTNEQVAERLRSVFVEQVVAVLAAAGPTRRGGAAGGAGREPAARPRAHPLPAAAARHRDRRAGRRGRGHRAERPALPHRGALLSDDGSEGDRHPGVTPA